jgi:sugar lactone lactonase YvrE
MKRRCRVTVSFSAWMVVTLLSSDVAPVAMPGLSAQTSPAEDLPEEISTFAPASPPWRLPATSPLGPEMTEGTTSDPVDEAQSGHLLFAPAIDGDGNPASNPISAEPVPVLDLAGEISGMVILAAQLQPEDPENVPSGVPVTFRLWNDKDIQWEETVRGGGLDAINAWVHLGDVHGGFAYQASAPGYGKTEVRRFRFDPDRASYTLHPDGAQLWYWKQGPGRVLLTLRSPVPLDPGRDQPTLIIIPQPGEEPAGGERDLHALFETIGGTRWGQSFPPVQMQIIDTYTATVSVQVPAGDYGFIGSVMINTPDVEHFYSQKIRLEVAQGTASPHSEAIWASPFTCEAGRRLVQYRAAEGEAVFDLVDADRVPEICGDQACTSADSPCAFPYQMLSQVEFERELAADREFRDLHDRAREMGYTHREVAVREEREDGSEIVVALLYSEVNGLVALFKLSSGLESDSMLLEIGEDSITFFDRDGGLTSGADGSLSNWLTHHSCNDWDCLSGCMAAKGAGSDQWNDPGFWHGIQEMTVDCPSCLPCLPLLVATLPPTPHSLAMLGSFAGCLGIFCPTCVGNTLQMMFDIADAAKECTFECIECQGAYGGVCNPCGESPEKRDDNPRPTCIGNIAAQEVETCVDCEWGHWLPDPSLESELCGADEQCVNGECEKLPKPDPQPPDDRQDVWQDEGGFYRGQTHDETIGDLSELIEQAQARGLWRAERLLTLRLRKTELARFDADVSALIDYQGEMEAIDASLQADLQGIISGTIPISPTQTITEALDARLTQAMVEIDALPYPHTRQQLQDGVDAAEMAYKELQGYESEVQHELHQLLSADVIGVAALGFADATLSALEAAGLPAQLVSLWPAGSWFQGHTALYLPPYAAPRALVVPAGGMHVVAGSPQARAWLDTYVAGGGLLIVFTQPFGDDWAALPGGEIHGVGYTEDQRCQHASVTAVELSDWLVWMGIPEPDIQVDGAFTAWPEMANVLLLRTRGTYAGYPAMIEYPYGEGTVLATTAYGDWAWQAGFWWGDDWQMTRTILARAWLLVHDQDVEDVPAANPNSTVTVSFPLTNTSVMTITSIKVMLPVRLGYWGSDYVDTVNLALAPGASETVTASLRTPPVWRGVHDWTQVGLYHLNLTINTADGSSHPTWGPFVHVRSPVVLLGATGFLQPERARANHFQAVALTATVRSYADTTRTLVVRGSRDLPTEPITLTVAPHGQAEHVYTVLMDRSKYPCITFFDESGHASIQRCANIQVAYPQLVADPIVPQTLSDGSVLSMTVTNRGSVASSGLATLTLATPSGTLVWTASRALSSLAAGETTTLSFTLTLPSLLELGTHHLQYRVEDGSGLNRVVDVPLRAQLATSVHLDRSSYSIREPLTMTVEVRNTGFVDLQPLLTLSIPDAGWSHTQPLTLPAGIPWTGIYALTLPDSLAAGPHEIHARLHLSDPFTRTTYFHIQPAAVLADVHAGPHVAGQSLPLTLTNAGGVDTVVTYTLSLRDHDNSQVRLGQDLVGTPIVVGGSAVISGSVPITVPTGSYRLDLTGCHLSDGRSIDLHYWVSVSGADVAARADPGPYSSGGALPVMLANHGSVDAVVTYTLSLHSGSKVFPLGSGSVGVMAQDAITVSGTLPEGLRSDGYSLHVDGAYTPGDRTLRTSQLVHVAGPSVELVGRTDRESYLSVDDITVTARLTNTGQPLPAGELNLSIARYGEAGGPWPIFEVYDPGNSGLTYTDVRAIAVDGAGNVWFGNHNPYIGEPQVNVDMLSADLETWQQFGLPLDAWAVSAIAIDGQNRKWFASDAGAACLSADHTTWITYTTDNSGLPSDDVGDVAVDGDGSAWFVTWGDISELTPGGEWITYTVDNSDLSLSWVEAVATDGEGNVWFGGYGGLNRLAPDGTWSSYSSWMFDGMYLVTVDGVGNVWAAYYHGESQGGVAVLWRDSEWTTFTTYMDVLTGYDVEAIAVDAKGRAWVGYYYNGLDILLEDGVTVLHYERSSDGLASDQINDIAVAPNGDVWLAHGPHPCGGEEVCGGATRAYGHGADAEVLWTREVTLSLDSADVFSDVSSLAASSLDATGKLYLRSVLTSTTANQVIARDTYPFYVFPTDVALTLETDRDVYQPGQTLVVTGALVNNSSLTLYDQWIGVDLDGEPIYDSPPFELPPGASYPYTVTTEAPFGERPVLVEAFAPSLYVEHVVQVAEPNGEAMLSVPEVAGHEPFSATVTLTNTGETDAIVQVSVAGGTPEWLALAPGQFADVARSVRIDDDALLTATVRGDLSFDLSQSVAWGEDAELTSLTSDAQVAGLVQVSYALAGSGALPTAVQLELDAGAGAELIYTATLQPGQIVIGDLLLDLPPGEHTLVGTLRDGSGRPLDQQTLPLSLQTETEAGVPDTRLLDVTISPSPVAAGESLTATLQLANHGAAGPVIVGLQAFGLEHQWIITPSAQATQTISLSMEVPADAPAGDYVGEATVEERRQPFNVTVTGTDVDLGLALNQPWYLPGDAISLTVTLTENAALDGDYTLSLRYLDTEEMISVTVPANQTVQYTFPFTATASGRASVTLANAPSLEHGQRIIVIDSLPVMVADPGLGVYLTSDRPVYDAGDTAYLTVTVTGMLRAVDVKGPMEWASHHGGYAAWSLPSEQHSPGVSLVPTGTYPLSYTFPAQLRTGRYTFMLDAGGESYDYPVDVRGWSVTSRRMTLDEPHYAPQDTLSAVVEFFNEGDTSIEDLRLVAWVFTPNTGEKVALLPPVSRPVDLEPGLNVFTVTGAFSSPTVGPHRLLVSLEPADEDWQVARAAAQFDVGWTHLVALTTDHGAYEVGEPGTGRLDVYGFGPTHLSVTATNGTTLLDVQRDLLGHETLNFTVPTTPIGDYVLTARSIDRDGNADQLTHAYQVPGPRDTEPPTLNLTYPLTDTLIVTTAPTTTIMVRGSVTDNSGSATVSIKGQTDTLVTAGDFVFPVEVQRGINTISVVASDEADNTTYSPVIRVKLMPTHGVLLAAAVGTVSTGQPLTYTVILTASGTIQDVMLFDKLPASTANPVAVASAGDVAVGEWGVTWYGDLQAGQPVTVTIRVTPFEEGPFTHTVTAHFWSYGVAEQSNPMTGHVGQSWRLYLPLICSRH